MIVDMEKYLFIGIKEDLDEFFKRAQNVGLLEFSSISQDKKPYALPKAAQDLLTALKILKKESIHIDAAYAKEFDVHDLVQRVIFLQNTLEKYHEEQRLLRQEIVRVSHFGEFSLQEVRDIEDESHRVVQFFFRNHAKREEPLPSEGLIYISADLHADYYIGIHAEAQTFQDFVEMHFDKSLGELKKRLELVEYDLKIYHEELKNLTIYDQFLTEAFFHELNRHHLQVAKEGVDYFFDGELFAVQAWVAVVDVPKMTPLIDKLSIHIEKIAIGPNEKIPTCMKNKGLAHVGEDLVKIYDIPSHEDKDPSIFVVAAFAIFFSMIVADAGYGMIYLVLSIIGYIKFAKKSSSIKRLLKLFVLISSCCVIWGVLIASYFGISLNPDNPFQKCSLIRELILKKAAYHMEHKDAIYQDWAVKIPNLSSVKTPLEFVLSIKKMKGTNVSYEILEDFNNSILMELALLVGMIHIIISLLRYSYRNLSSVGWICFMVGGYLFFPFIMNNATSMINFLGLVPKQAGREIGQQLVYIGIGLAWVLALIQHKKKGLEEPLKSIQIFADVLSYLRLYALSLAGMIMAATFNQMGQDVGYVLGFFIIIAGHLLNMTIGIMGGFIHGLRLNFLEWYHYSFDGGGKLFNPLKILK